ncbi:MULTISPECIES: hypothetical protein [unclassified Corallococcus]|uniref:hypothetical protein n=1 Tax=unclassified Corallococcus TaxID=2685029 RepID=UPI001A8F8DE6|nr:MULTISPECIES: hypothetical protein [unclassified Corallococcus]MBN9685100.1 hypothetical protein [Corallococcus sp. NCSPR001]WAS83441.1 hypothetical protein O0N60_29515 [Corallococcus sp. NCRR]
MQPSGAHCGKCNKATLDADTPTIRFNPSVPLVTKLELQCFGTAFTISGKQLLKWWHEIAIAYVAKVIDAELLPQNLLTLGPLSNYVLFGEPGDISTFDGEDHDIPIGIPSTKGCQKIFLLKNLFTDCTKTKDKEAYALCAQLIGDKVGRAPSYHEFALYFRKRTAHRSDREVAEHLLDVIAQKANPKDIMEALFLGASLGSEFLRNRTSFIDTLLCLKLVVAGALTMNQLIVGGQKGERVRISAVFPLTEGHFPDLEISGKYRLTAEGIRAARYVKELQLEPGTVEVETTEAHNSSKTDTDANCWIQVKKTVDAFDHQGDWPNLGVMTCNPSQLGGALPMTGHATQSLGSNDLMVQLLNGDIAFTQVQAKTVTNIVRMLHTDCSGGFPVFFNGAFNRDVNGKIVKLMPPQELRKLIAGFVRRQMVEMVFGEAEDVPTLTIEELGGTPIQDAVGELDHRFPQ